MMGAAVEGDASPSNAGDGARAEATEPARARAPVVVEMFLSQACANCPAAAKVTEDYVEDPRTVVLTWHVDYWDTVTHPTKGRWRDPYAKSAFSARQRQYNVTIRGRGRVFTPQAVVDGRSSIIGSRQAKVEAALAEAAALHNAEPETSPRIIFESGDGQPNVHVEGLNEGETALLVQFYDRARSSIHAGYNAGKVFESAHVVHTIAPLPGDGARAPLPALATGDGCAVIVQQAAGAVRTGSYCPR